MTFTTWSLSRTKQWVIWSRNSPPFRIQWMPKASAIMIIVRLVLVIKNKAKNIRRYISSLYFFSILFSFRCDISICDADKLDEIQTMECVDQSYGTLAYNNINMGCFFFGYFCIMQSSQYTKSILLRKRKK